MDHRHYILMWFLLTPQRPVGGELHRPSLFLKTHISVTPNPFFVKFYGFSSDFIYFQMQKKKFSNFEQGCRGNQLSTHGNINFSDNSSLVMLFAFTLSF